MLNYIKAEFYKAARRKYARNLLLIMLALESLLVLLAAAENAMEFAHVAAAMAITMPVGSFLAVLLADITVSDPAKTGTLKNEVSFGLTRSRVYLGKLWSAVLVAVLFCAALFAWYLGGSWLLTAHGSPGDIRAVLAVLGYVAAASLPLWLGVLGLTVALMMNLKSGTAAATAVFLLLTVGPGVLGLATLLTWGLASWAAWLLLSVLPIVPSGAYQGALTWQLMAKNWAIGLGWLAVSTSAGLWVFRRREVK